MRSELPVIQKAYELLLWMAPVVQKLPRSHRFVLGAEGISTQEVL